MKKFILFLSTMLIFSIMLLHPVIAEANCTCRDPYCVYNTKTETGARKKITKLINKYIRYGKHKSYKIKFIKTKDLTLNKLLQRKRKKIIYVEVSTGYVMNDVLYDGLLSDGYYISYMYVDDTLPKGSCIRTYCIYNPFTTYEDDIIYRSDRVINTKKNTKQIRKAKKKFKKNFGYAYR